MFQAGLLRPLDEWTWTDILFFPFGLVLVSIIAFVPIYMLLGYTYDFLEWVLIDKDPKPDKHE